MCDVRSEAHLICIGSRGLIEQPVWPGLGCLLIWGGAVGAHYHAKCLGGRLAALFCLRTYSCIPGDLQSDVSYYYDV
eukprot:scaffold82912_cov44-Prasinocladus_malaysianus.AAC.3